MRENETRIGGLQWGLFSIFEPSAPHPHRTIDQSVVAWRLASRVAGAAAFDNARTVQQQKFGLETSRGERIRDTTLNPELFNVLPYNPEELARSGPLFPRRPMTAEQVRARRAEHEANIRSGFRYPTAEEVAEIQRRFRNPELEHAMEVARQEIMRRYWPRNVTLEPQEYFERMTRLISEPAPPGFREAMRAAAGDIEEEENLR